MADNITPGQQPGTQQPGAATPNPGTGENSFDPSKFVSTEDFGRTAAMIGGMKKTIEQLAALVPNLPTLDKFTELGLLEKGDDGSYKPRSASQQPQQQAAGAKPKTEDNPLRAEFEALQRKLAEKDRLIEERDQQTATEKRNNAVRAALAKAGAINPDRDLVHVAGKVVAIGDGFGAKSKDKWGAEVDVSLDEVAELFLKENPELKKGTAQPGSGTPAGGSTGATNANGSKVIPKAQWQDMNWYARNREKFVSGEFTWASNTAIHQS